MKKIVSLLLVLISVLAMGVSSMANEGMPAPPEGGDYLYQILDARCMNKIKDNMPEKIILCIDRSGNESIAVIKDKDIIKKLVEAFVKVQILDDMGMSVTDNYNYVVFSFADEDYTVNFELTTLDLYQNGIKGLYNLDNFDEFWKLMNEYTDKYSQFPEFSCKLNDLKERIGHIEKLECTMYSEDGVTEMDLTESADEVAEKLSEVMLYEETDLMATDWDEIFHFTYDDGTEESFWFNGGNYCAETEDGELITFLVDNYKNIV